MKTTRVLLVCCGLLTAVPLQGCSVGMALSGQENPDLTVVRVGAARAVVEQELGEPIETTTLEDGRRADVYAYELGDPPSGARALGHGALDILTFGVWEIFGTVAEARKGDTYHSTVTYDQSDRIADIRTMKVGASEENGTDSSAGNQP